MNATHSSIEARPLLIAKCVSTNDVARTIAFARGNRVDLAVRAPQLDSVNLTMGRVRLHRSSDASGQAAPADLRTIKA